MGKIFKKLAKWVVKHGFDEMQKEIDRRNAAAADAQDVQRGTSRPTP